MGNTASPCQELRVPSTQNLCAYGFEGFGTVIEAICGLQAVHVLADQIIWNGALASCCFGPDCAAIISCRPQATGCNVSPLPAALLPGNQSVAAVATGVVTPVSCSCLPAVPGLVSCTGLHTAQDLEDWAEEALSAFQQAQRLALSGVSLGPDCVLALQQTAPQLLHGLKSLQVLQPRLMCQPCRWGGLRSSSSCLTTLPLFLVLCANAGYQPNMAGCRSPAAAAEQLPQPH